MSHTHAQASAASLLPSEAPVQLVSAAGSHTPVAGYALPDDATLTNAFAALLAGRRMNDQCNALVRQGRLAVYPSSHGQEACQVAAAFALADSDWMFPTYRDSVAVMARGVAPADAMTLLRGDWHSGYDPHEFASPRRPRHSPHSSCTPRGSRTLPGCEARTPLCSRCVVTAQRARETFTRR